ncbi:MAG TPA: hypothetical protein VMM55_03975 [Thermohalobaculum sp.]|nr:hypothetical protein [Thermohalobaculum sp.]
MLQILANSFMLAARTEPRDERALDRQAAARTRCRRAIEEDGYAAARMRGACGD